MKPLFKQRPQLSKAAAVARIFLFIKCGGFGIRKQIFRVTNHAARRVKIIRTDSASHCCNHGSADTAGILFCRDLKLAAGHIACDAAPERAFCRSAHELQPADIRAVSRKSLQRPARLKGATPSISARARSYLSCISSIPTQQAFTSGI